MSYQDTFEHILAALYDAMLDDARWPAASALIDEACGITGNDLMVGEGPKDDVQADFVGVYSRGQRREDLEREYLENYHPTDERVPRFRQLPDSRPTHVTDLYTAEELKTSPTYNEALGVCAAENRCDNCRRADDERGLDVDNVSPLRARAVAVVAARCAGVAARRSLGAPHQRSG